MPPLRSEPARRSDELAASMTPPSDATRYLPSWTERMPVKSGGRDPLGLSRVANRIMDDTLPGIVTTTNRARYYSLYCWILWSIAREEQPRSRRAFQQAFMRRESPIAMASILAGDDDSPVGVDAAKEKLEKGRPAGGVQTAYRVLPSHALGGYGQYYAGPLYRLGLTGTDANGLPCVSSPLAERLAEAVHATVSDTPWWKHGGFRANEVPLRDLESSAAALALSALERSEARDERRLLIDLFFGRGPQPVDVEARFRRESLGLILELVRQHEEGSAPVDAETPGQQILRGALYAGRLRDRNGEYKRRLARPETMPPSYYLWRLFMAHEYLIMAIEGLFWSLLEVASRRPEGVGLEEIVKRFTSPPFESTLRDLLGERASTPYHVMSAIGIRSVPTGADCRSARAEAPHGREYDEETLADAAPDTPQAHAARCCLLLALLYRKWRQGRELDVSRLAQGAINDLWAETVLPALDEWVNPGVTWPEMLADFMKRFVLDVHRQVLIDKHRQESRWFEWSSGRIVKTQDLEPYMRGSRIGSATHILRDLKLLRVADGDVLTLTAEGERVRLSVFQEPP